MVQRAAAACAAGQVGEDDLLGSSHGGIVEPRPCGRVLVPQATSG